MIATALTAPTVGRSERRRRVRLSVGGNACSKRDASKSGRFALSPTGKDLLAMYYGEDLFEDDDDNGADRVEGAVTHIFVGVFETAAWLIGGVLVGALVGTDVKSSPWFWVVLLALPPIVALALWLRRTRKQERITFGAEERS
jgi:F0F1-type ATP synthase assembly protein I